MGKLEYTVIALSALAGMLFWCIDAGVDSFVFAEGSYLEFLISDIPIHCIYIRTLVFVMFLIVGFIISKTLTGRRRAEQALRRSEERFRNLVEASSDWIWEVDSSGTYTYCSPQCKKVLGYEPEEILGKTPFDFMPPGERTRVQGVFESCASSKVPIDELENTNRHKDGHDIILETNGVPILDSTGNLVGYRGIDRDITGRKRAEEELRESEGKFRAITSSAQDAIVMIDNSGNINYWNPAAEKIFGYKRNEVLGEELHLVLAPKRFHEAYRQGFEKFRRTGKGPAVGRTLELAAVRKDGTEFPMELSLSAAKTNGKWSGIAVIRDITERKQAEEELVKAKEEAEAASKAKSEFVANMSHEIRTPMNGIIGMTQLALGTELSSEQCEYISTVRESADSLLKVINDVLDFSKIEAGKLNLESADFNIRDCIAGTVRSLAVKAREKDLELAYQVHPDVPEVVVGDCWRLRQVLTNLAGNAIKFTEHGEVLVNVWREALQEERMKLHFSVRDTGIGIEEDKLEMIFDAFTQADGSTTRMYGGTGLGLAISSRLVSGMGGEIWVESRAGAGSTFHFTATFELVECGSDASSMQDGTGDSDQIEVFSNGPNRSKGDIGGGGEKPGRGKPAKHGLRVLLAEDNPINQRLTFKLLQKRGHEVTVATTGTEAIEAYQRQEFDVILMDVQMPEISGFEVARKIRQVEESTGRHTPVVALTAHAMEGDRQRCFEAGMDAYISKPFRPDHLVQLLEETAACSV
jgi:PAS domain S-box-containing protein